MLRILHARQTSRQPRPPLTPQKKPLSSDSGLPIKQNPTNLKLPGPTPYQRLPLTPTWLLTSSTQQLLQLRQRFPGCGVFAVVQAVDLFLEGGSFADPFLFFCLPFGVAFFQVLQALLLVVYLAAAHTIKGEYDNVRQLS